MKDVIIPVDFSETSLHAARYAADMLSGKPDIRVILYNMYEKEDEVGTINEYLQNLRIEMEAKGISNIELVIESGDDLIDCLGRLAHQKTAELIVMGITEKEEWKQMLFGSKTLKMAEQNICPVMIIPPDADFKGVKNVALASDFKDVENDTPVLAIKNVLELFNASLHIVNVDNQHYVALTDEYLAERAKMQKLFADFKPEFYFIGMNDFIDAIEQFTKDRNIDLVITIPKNRSFLDTVLNGSSTRKLAFQTSVPLLAAHQ
jgi:nucleotide-binding universal stress UspA family protein